MSACKLIHGDCAESMLSMESCSVDAIVTDPPYGLGFMGKAWDELPPGDEVAAAMLHVLKPGGHVAAFGGTRTYHRLACALEDAGFEIRDSLMWIYGSGFPKSLDVSKAIDKAAGQENIIGTQPDRWTGKGNALNFSTDRPQSECKITAPATPEAEQWQGFGTALKPAHEPIVLARKPLVGTVAANVQEHGTGALNVDGCRVDASGRPKIVAPGTGKGGRSSYDVGSEYQDGKTDTGRWPPNILLTHSACCGDECGPCCPVAEMDRQSEIGGIHGAGSARVGSSTPGKAKGGWFGNANLEEMHRFGDSGGASRFFPRFRYVAKASTGERNAGLEGMAEVSRPVQIQQTAGRQMAGLAETLPAANIHPTVKPIQLMRWLCRLITPPGGTVLDPFAGSGTTLIAALQEGFGCIGIEREAEYVELARRRVEGDSPLFNSVETGGKG